MNFSGEQNVPSHGSRLEPPELRGEMRRFYFLFGCSQFLVDSSIWFFYLTAHRGLPLSQAAAIQATITLAIGVFDLPTGCWADRFGRRRMVIIGLFSRATAAMLMIIASKPAALLLASIIGGFGWAQVSGALEAFFHDNLKARGLEHTFKARISNTVCVNYLSRTLAFMLSGILYTLHPSLPYVGLIIALSCGCWLAFAIPEHPFEQAGSSTTLPHIHNGIRVLTARRTVLIFVSLLIVFLVTSEQIWFSFQPLLAAIGLNPLLVGFIYAASSLGSAAGAYYAKQLVTRHREEVAMTTSVSLLGVGGILFLVAQAPMLALFAQFVSCVGFGMSWAASSSIIHPHLPSSHRAVCLSLISTIQTIGIGAVGIWLGYIFEHFGRHAVPATLVFVCLALAPYMHLSVKAVKYDKTCA